jgi:hypothetical protein
MESRASILSQALAVTLGCILFHTTSVHAKTYDPRNLATLNIPGTTIPQVPIQSASGPPYSLYPNIPALFAFGDGGQDVGNVLYLGHDMSTAHYPFGKSFYNLTGRFSDGRVFSDFFGESV